MIYNESDNMYNSKINNKNVYSNNNKKIITR